MNESMPTQKEFGEIVPFEDGFQIKRFGTKDDIVAQATLVESAVSPTATFSMMSWFTNRKTKGRDSHHN